MATTASTAAYTTIGELPPGHMTRHHDERTIAGMMMADMMMAGMMASIAVGTTILLTALPSIKQSFDYNKLFEFYEGLITITSLLRICNRHRPPLRAS
jgi:hypothetical protein